MSLQAGSDDEARPPAVASSGTVARGRCGENQPWLTSNEGAYMFPISAVLHPTDFSPRSEEAFQVACSLARDAGARLVVLHVLERPVIVHSGVAMAPPEPPPPQAERGARLEQLHQVRPPDPAVAVEHRLE